MDRRAREVHPKTRQSSPSDETFLEMGPLVEAHQFATDERGIVHLKVELLEEAEDFLWFRESDGTGGDVFGYLTLAMNALADKSLIGRVGDEPAYAAAQRAADGYPFIGKHVEMAARRFAKAPWDRKPRELRLLLWSGDMGARVRPLYETQGYEVRLRQDATLRWDSQVFLNEKRFCLFFKAGEGSFFGIIGTDEQTRSHLCRLFEEEWSATSRPEPWNSEFERSCWFYRENFESLLAEYRGKYVAIIGDKVVDSDLSFHDLATRVYEKYGYRDILMPKVARPRVIRMHGLRINRV